jgi:formamidopyrimidine-DNA glycosylase
MPELPEVETTVRALRQPLIGRTIEEVRNTWPRHIATPDLAEMQWRIHGQQVETIGRRAKYLLFHLSGGETLIVHLKMTGHLYIVPAAAPPDKHAHTIFTLDQGDEFRFQDTRKFGRVYLVRNLDEVLGSLGPEPLEPTFTPDLLRERLRGRSRALKPLLLEQAFIAGVGNIYADEALHAAGLHPLQPADSLDDAALIALHAAIQKVLRLGIEREGASIDHYRLPSGEKGDMQNAVAVFQRTGQPCYRCGTPIERIVVGGRSTHFCPHCQPLRSI